MSNHFDKFGAVVRGTDLRDPIELRSDEHFRLDEVRISESLSLPLLDIDYDLFRLGMSVYAADRLIQRRGASNDRAAHRELILDIPVSDPDFWNAHTALVCNILEFLSDDRWQIKFSGGAEYPNVPPFLYEQVSEPCRVCLYSGGLDSAAGLPIRLSETQERFFALTALHQPHQELRIRRHFRKMCCEFGPRISSITARTTLIHPFRMDQQELSQRCRSFLFASLGGIVASRLGAHEIEIFENGVGILNLPPMTGMLWGGRATRGCHPVFLRKISELITAVAGRRIKFSVPFKQWTKSEMVSRLSGIRMDDLVSDAVSCVHYPLRIRGKAKQCGLCPGCLGSRQAALAADMGNDAENFENDILNPNLSDLPPEKLAHLRQQLLQVGDLQELAVDGSRPEILRRHLAISDAATHGDRIENWTALLGRYRDEWMKVVQLGRERGCHWAGWLDGVGEQSEVLSLGGQKHERAVTIGS